MVKKCCLHLATILNVAEPNEHFIDWLFTKYNHVTPSVFRICCKKLSYYETYKFPGSGAWQKEMQAAHQEAALKKKIVYEDIPESEKPSSSDFKQIYDMFQNLEDNLSFDPDFGNLRCKNKYMEEQMLKNEEILRERKRMKEQVKRMKKLRSEGYFDKQ